MSTNGAPLRVALYARVSKNDASRDPQNQLTPLRTYAKALGGEIVEEYVDLASGGSGGWLEPANAFLNTCQEASSVAWQENPAAQKSLLKLLAGRITLTDRTLCFDYISPFQLVVEMATEEKWGPLSPSAAIRLAPLIWDPDMEESEAEPLYIILPNKYFTVYEHGRRRLLSGQLPPDLARQHGIRVRTWRAYQHRMAQEPAWERAERYRRMLQEQGSRSIRALARTLGEDHSRMAKVLTVRGLPERVLATLRVHADHARIRARFTERYLRQLVREQRDETSILQEINQIVQVCPARQLVPS